MLRELAERLGVSIRHVRRLVAERRLPYLKVGWLVRFDPAEIAAWLDGARHPEATRHGRSA
ncbi:MAG TPA: helix-turn-helix domain-containing protein [Acidimicrobiales bacterium]|nr:helix-turn-helix domain-containing protein [Acidimicrobiales bacterium]